MTETIDKTQELESKVDKLTKTVELLIPKLNALTDKYDNLKEDMRLFRHLTTSTLSRIDHLEHPDLTPSLQAFNQLRKKLGSGED